MAEYVEDDVTGIIDDIFDLFARFGAGHYGEDVSLEQHMLQSAAMAEALGASRELVTAALLHDVGHFLHADSEHAIGEVRDLEHETLGAKWLARSFGVAITAPIALHVRAKRYLCAVELPYFERLSEASKLSLAVQGGVMTEAEAAAFATEASFDAAVFLRRCDDLGKELGASTKTLEDYRKLLEVAVC